MPDIQVFTDFARLLFLLEKDLRIPEYVLDAPISSPDPWPSWLPNWSYTGQSDRTFGGGTNVFKAADAVSPTLSFSENGKSLIVKEILVDTVTEALGVPCNGYFMKGRVVHVEPAIFSRYLAFHQVYMKAMRAISVSPTSSSVDELKRFILVNTSGTDMRHPPVDLDRLSEPFIVWMDSCCFGG
ncbi:hypothetical protein G647_07390 [Cladophialophora carrionii CBS 160.54]|uniref:Uncharacterized protein n=1 Tax=Cladophialophora carrionii CBS 160.54 TaxID=1279043 RepID=V9D4W6_9EURO|nr:uncharacterized protein G647_07390 [Cladophialophora carrionii CBS 160.54]ETI21047.1 hypothetical protein G647_07390 [Cladophialophora carrionii CBS 160.54]